MRIKESKLWILFFIAGGAMVILLGIHMLIVHCDFLLTNLGLAPAGEHVLSSQSVIQRSQSITHAIIYLFLLALALFHGFYGLRSILHELPLSLSLKKAVDGLSLTAGVFLFIWGFMAIIIGLVKM